MGLPRYCTRCKLQSPPDERACVACGGKITEDAPVKSAPQRSSESQRPSGPARRSPPSHSGPARRRTPPRQAGPADKGPPPPPKLSFHALLGEGQDQEGPFDYAQLERLVRERRLNSETLVWKKGMGDWVAAGTLASLAALFDQPPPPPRPSKPPPPSDEPPPPPAKAPSKPQGTSGPMDRQAPIPEAAGSGGPGNEETQRWTKDSAEKMRAMAKAVTTAQSRARRERPSKRLRPEQIKGYLCCEPFRAVPLAEGRPISVGRSRTADLVLPHESVSRTHALVRVLGDTITIEDKSTYGLHLNGKRVHQGPVAVGDTIQLGPYVVSVRDVPDRTAQQMGEEVTRPLRTLGATSEAMHGRLERVSLAEVLQQIEFNRKTGTLRVFDDANVASTLVVYEGAPVYAESLEINDAEVVHGMLRLKRGQFSFSSKVEAGEMTMQGQTLTGILLDFSRLEDEG